MVDRIPVVVVERDTDGCLLVISHRPGKGGYIPYTLDGVHTTLHRIVASAQVGDSVDHLCHNADPSCPGGACKHRRCINPDHLDLTTPAENIQRAHAGGRYRKAHCKNGHPLTPDNLYIGSGGGRQCRTCTRERSAERYRRLHSG